MRPWVQKNVAIGGVFSKKRGHMTKCLKPFKTFEEQVGILKTRGLVIDDEIFAAEVLSHVNYYRFSGYAFMRQDKMSVKQSFHSGTTFESIYALYEFDQRMRNIIIKKRYYFFSSRFHKCIWSI